MLDRRQRLLAGIDTLKLVGLEIGPLDKPLIIRDTEHKIYYADYAPREALQKNSREDVTVNIDSIPEIDYVSSGLLPDKLDREFDHIIALHVAEHVPDFIGWVVTMFGWLKPGGRVLLAIPDKRYCFDLMRTPSSAGQLLEAFFESRPHPNFSSVYDGIRQAVHFDTWRAWNDPDYSGPFKPLFSPEDALDTARRALLPGYYQDCHCWVFTHHTFVSAINEINALGIVSISVLRDDPPVYGSNEFHVVLAPQAVIGGPNQV